MVKARTAVLCIFVLVIFISCGSSESEPRCTDALDTSPKRDLAPAYTIHAPILITDNSGFLASGFIGFGNETHPYVLEGVNITSDIKCIEITDTTSHFVIRDCIIRAETSATAFGIQLSNASNGSVDSCIISFKHSGIVTYGANNHTLTNNSISGTKNGVHIQYSTNYILTNNTIDENSQRGVWIVASNNTKLTNNTISDNIVGGVVLSSVHNCSLIDNSIRNNPVGINLGMSENCTLINNTLVNNGFVLGGTVPQLLHNITGNTVNGKPFVFFRFLADTVVDGSLYGQIFMLNCQNVTVSGGHFYNASKAITISLSNWCKVVNTTIDGTSTGIHLSISHWAEITNVTISGGLLGIDCQSSHYGVFLNNTIIDCAEDITVDNCEDTTFVNNTLGSGGLFFDEPLYLQNWRHDIENNTVQGRPIVYYWGLEDTVLDGSAFGQIILANCTRVTVQDSIISNVSCGVAVGHGSNITIQDVTVEGSLHDGLFISNTPYAILTNSTISNCNGYGVLLGGGSTYSSFISNVIHENNQDGIRIVQSPGCSLVNNSVYANSESGIVLSRSQPSAANYLVSGNALYENLNAGLILWWGSQSNIVDNVIYDNSAFGMIVQDSDNCTIISNVIHDNWEGIWLNIGSNNTIYGNVIGWQNNVNAVDTGSSNTWDDGVRQGNWWSDYVGPGNYSIGGSAGSFDRYPAVIIPLLSHPPDVEYELGTFGYSITWTASVVRPDSYEILRNSTSIELDDWDGSAIVVSVDGLSLGSYTYTLVTNNTDGSVSSDSVYVTVAETIDPTTDSPPDVQFEAGTPNNIVSWSIYDLNPLNYTILLNGSVLESGDWSTQSEMVAATLDAPLPGWYNLTLVIFDVVGHTSSDIVIVTVVDTTPPDINHPADLSLELGTEGSSIVWTPSDFLPSTFTLLKDGSLDNSGEWNGSQLLVSLDDLFIGDYNFTVIVYDSSGNYAVDTVLVTIADTTAPSVVGPIDLEVEGMIDDETITWIPFDFDPNYYYIYINGTLAEDGVWNEALSAILIDVDNNVIGVYNYTIVVRDGSGHTSSDTVIVTVADTTNPTIDHPVDVVFDYADTEPHSIIWNPDDPYPYRYEIYRNGELLEAEGWDGSEIQEALGGVLPGVYNYTIVVYDESGNRVSDYVRVEIGGTAEINWELIVQIATLSVATITGLVGFGRWMRGRVKKPVEPASPPPS